MEDEKEGCPDYVVDGVGRFDFECGCISCEMETRWQNVVMFLRYERGVDGIRRVDFHWLVAFP